MSTQETQFDEDAWREDLNSRHKWIFRPSMKTPPTKQELAEMELEHNWGGIGWMMVQDIDDDHCRIAPNSTKPVATAFLVAKNQLRVSYRIGSDSKRVPARLHQQSMARIAEFQADIEAGRKYIRDTFVLNAEPHL